MSRKNTAATPIGGLGLEGISNLSDLLSGRSTNAPAASGPLMIDLALIDEDPQQPRHADNPGFSPESLEELACTIRLRGVKSPISVREHPDAEGRYIINHGARRFRASRLAGKTTIPAFIDPDYSEADQVVENLQRDNLTAREIADFVGRELAAGKKKGEIAQAIGKSRAFISQHVTLLDLPDPIAVVFGNGRCNDVTVINELVTAYKANAEVVTTWLADDTQEITRGSVKLLRAFIEEKKNKDTVELEPLQEAEPEPEPELMPQDDVKDDSSIPDPDKLKKVIVLITHDGRAGRLLLNRRPSREGAAWIKYDDDGAEVDVSLEQVLLVSILEG